VQCSYESIFRQASQGGVHTVIVMMPMSPYRRQAFYSQPAWHEYSKALAALAHLRGIDLIDASDWVQSEQDFADHLHMSPQGTQSISVYLGEAIAKPPTEMPAVPGRGIEPRSE
jgi:lysophospholipase L1-like esterase